MKKFLGVITAAVTFAPAFVFAADAGLIGATSGLKTIVDNLTKAANALIPFFLAIAVVVFIYGVIKYILATGAEDKSAARGYIIYGIIGIAVIVSLFGVIALLQSTFGVDGSAPATYPQFNPAP